MKKERRKHDVAVKGKVVLEVIRGQKTLSQISSEYGVHPNQITNWKRQFFEALPELFHVMNTAYSLFCYHFTLLLRIIFVINFICMDFIQINYWQRRTTPFHLGTIAL